MSIHFYSRFRIGSSTTTTNCQCPREGFPWTYSREFFGNPIFSPLKTDNFTARAPKSWRWWGETRLIPHLSEVDTAAQLQACQQALPKVGPYHAMPTAHIRTGKGSPSYLPCSANFLEPLQNMSVSREFASEIHKNFLDMLSLGHLQRARPGSTFFWYLPRVRIRPPLGSLTGSQDRARRYVGDSQSWMRAPLARREQTQGP